MTSILLRLPAHFSYNEFNFKKKCACQRTLATRTSIFCACLRTLATMNSNLHFCACLRTLATMTSNFSTCLRTLATMNSNFLFWRLPAHFTSSDFKKIAPAGAL
jgi:hypothetical protein